MRRTLQRELIIAQIMACVDSGIEKSIGMKEAPSSVCALVALGHVLSLIAISGPQISETLLRTMEMTKATVVVMIEAEWIIQRNRRTKVAGVHLVQDRVVSLTRLLARPQRVLAVPQVHNLCALRLLLQV